MGGIGALLDIPLSWDPGHNFGGQYIGGLDGIGHYWNDPALRLPERGMISTTPHYNPLLLQQSKADVMGIGVMLYEILTGTLPFDEVPWEYAGREQGGHGHHQGPGPGLG